MSTYAKICAALLGISMGFLVLFSIDMIYNSGKFLAHAIHQKAPGCSGACHGQDFTRATRELALRQMVVERSNGRATLMRECYGY